MTRAGDHDAPELALAGPLPDPGPIVWKRTFVDDRPAHYAVVGRGAPVLFLHGWALGHHTYRAVLRRIAARGRLVYAPALPGSGATPDLPPDDLTLNGYAAWVGRFAAAVGIDPPVTVIGHSFGGGVAICLAHDQPDLVESLVLVNSIGGSAWRRGQRVGSMAERPLWDWGIRFPFDLWPLHRVPRVLPAVLEDAVPNLVRSPRSVWRVAQLARGADLQPELEAIRRRGMPATVIWASGDGIVPRESYEALAAALGVEGQVVAGGHTWLLADPDGFGAAIAEALAHQRTGLADAAVEEP